MKKPTLTGIRKDAPDGYFKVMANDPTTWKACVCGPECSPNRGECNTLGCRCWACYNANPDNPTFIRFRRRDPDPTADEYGTSSWREEWAENWKPGDDEEPSR